MLPEFEIRNDVQLDATVDEVWTAIATGPGMTAWFMPMDTVSPDGAGVTAYDPPRRLVVELPAGPDGTTQAFEYLVEARGSGSAVLRLVHSGFLGDDWTGEFEAMTRAGWDMYLHTLAQYFTHFRGRTASYVGGEGPASSTRPEAWRVLLDALGLSGTGAVGDEVRLTVAGATLLAGVVDYASPTHIGVRTGDGLYRFHGRAALGMPIAVGHHIYAATGSAAVDVEPVQRSWRQWLGGLID